MKFFLILSLLGLLSACQSSRTEDCDLTFNHVSKNFGDKIKPIYKKDSIIEVSDIGDGFVYGGYYNFTHGKLESYRFFTKDRTRIGSEPSKEKVYTYIESFEGNSHFKSILGIPLVYKRATRQRNDSIKVEAFLFSLNRKFEPILINSNIGFKVRAEILDDTIFTNMKKIEFVFKPENTKDLI